MEDEDKQWKELNEGLEAIMITGEYEKAFGECPLFPHLLKMSQWLNGIIRFKKGYQSGMKRMLSQMVNSGWLKPDSEEKLRKQLENF